MRTTSPPPSPRDLSLPEHQALPHNTAGSPDTITLPGSQATQQFSALRRIGTAPRLSRSAFVNASAPDTSRNTIEDYHKAWDAWACASKMRKGELRAQSVRKLKRFLANPPESGYLSLRGEKISAMPPLLPPSLKRLNISSNAFKKRPIDLPESLTRVDVSHNALEQFSTILPNLLIDLQLSGNQLSSVAMLPPVLQYFNASRNRLTTLPALPASLKFLGVAWNLLAALPALPEKLGDLDAANNQLETLPPLPSTLFRLTVSNNSLKELPPLPPSLRDLDASNNNLTELPPLPDTLVSLNVENNPHLNLLPALPNGLRNLLADNKAGNRTIFNTCRHWELEISSAKWELDQMYPRNEPGHVPQIKEFPVHSTPEKFLSGYEQIIRPPYRPHAPDTPENRAAASALEQRIAFARNQFRILTPFSPPYYQNYKG